MTARLVLGEGGLLAQALPGFSPRPAQLAMSELVENALLGAELVALHLALEQATAALEVGAAGVDAADGGRGGVHRGRLPGEGVRAHGAHRTRSCGRGRSGGTEGGMSTGEVLRVRGVRVEQGVGEGLLVISVTLRPTGLPAALTALMALPARVLRAIAGHVVVTTDQQGLVMEAVRLEVEAIENEMMGLGVGMGAEGLGGGA